MSRDANYATKDMAAVPAGSAADYKAAFAQKSASAFAAAFAEDVVLEAAAMYSPVSGRENVKRVMEAASKIYESLQFTDQAIEGHRQYLEWKARAFGDIGMSFTVITRNEAGAIAHVAILHRPLGGALRFSAEIGQVLQGVIDASHFLAAEDLPRTARS
jgi:hypothetical protein